MWLAMLVRNSCLSRITVAVSWASKLPHLFVLLFDGPQGVQSFILVSSCNGAPTFPFAAVSSGSSVAVLCVVSVMIYAGANACKSIIETWFACIRYLAVPTSLLSSALCTSVIALSFADFILPSVIHFAFAKLAASIRSCYLRSLNIIARYCLSSVWA